MDRPLRGASFASDQSHFRGVNLLRVLIMMEENPSVQSSYSKIGILIVLCKLDRRSELEKSTFY